MTSHKQRRPRTASPSPAPQPLSKRDKRRTILSDKLSDMFASFSNNYADHFYAQLAAIKCDMNLILQADPYTNTPLEDDSEEIAELVERAREELYRSRPWGPDGEASFSALSGRYYAKYVNEINTAMEERDKSLTEVYNKHQNSLDELRRSNQYKIQLAHEEHQLLSKSLRDRLIQGVTQRRTRLLRDKEQLDIADSNALLLNPNQFSIGHPASPGGPTSNRKTRHTRLRPGEQAEDTTSTAVLENQRKRKAAFQDDNGSPAPLNRIAEIAMSTPFRDARAKQVYSQFEAPLYSIDRLFTEKELAMNMNRAHVATSDFFTKLKEQKMHAASGGGTNGNSTRTDLHDGTAAASVGTNSHTQSALNGADLELDLPPPGSPQPGATVPQQVFHATRAAHRANPLADLATTATVMPPYAINISAAASKANPSAPPLPGLSEAEAASDVQLMQRGTSDPVYDRLVDRSCEQYGSMVDTAMWRAAAEGDAMHDHNGHGVEGHGTLNAASLAMARQTSAYGMGGVPMSRTTSAAISDMGGMPMARTASTADHAARSRR